MKTRLHTVSVIAAIIVTILIGIFVIIHWYTHNDSLRILALFIFLIAVSVLLAVTLFSIRNNIAVRKKTEEELRKTDEQIQTIFDAAPDAVIVINDAGHIVRWNPKAEMLFGWKENEVAGKLLSETIIPDRFREVHTKGLENFLRTGEGPLLGKIIETCAVTKNGIELDVALNIAATPKIKGQYLFVGFVRDITGLKKTEKKFEELLEAAPDAMVIVNDRGEIVLVNKQTEILFGYARHELISKKVELLIPADFRSRHQGHRDKYFTDPKVRSMGAGLELFAIRRDGIQFPVEISLSPLQTEEGLLVSASIRDITQRKEIAEKLKRIEEQYRMMIDEVEEYAIILLDNDGVIKNWNRGAEKIKGYTAEEIIGKNFRLFYTKEDQLLKVPEHLIEDAKQNGKASIEGLRVRKDGTTFWGNVSVAALHNEKGEIIGFTKVTRDITDRKKAEEKFRSLLDSAPDATVIVNENGIIQMINDQTENLFGYTKEEIIGQPVEILIPPELKDKHVGHRATFIKAARVRSMGAGIELNAVKKNGMRFPVEISLSPIETEEGLLVSASVRDISLRKGLEDELKKSNAELEAFTYSVSHDLRAPLRGIIGFTAILEEEYASKLDDEARRITSVIKSNALKMGHLVDDLLAFSRMGKQELIKTDIDTKEMINEIINELAHHNNKIDWDIRSLPYVKADINTIRQVWINLISNAIKYSGTKENPRIEIGSYLQNRYTVFYIRDNGVGFDEEYKDKLFKVFQRLHDDEEFEGTGVGLAIVEKIISRHGGKVWAEGKENQGACFYFSLPRD